MPHLSLRLDSAFKLLRPYSSVADIGCDHGKLTEALARVETVRSIVASDISVPSLEKARDRIFRQRLSDKVCFRIGNGFSVLSPGECSAAAVLGLGGEEMVRMLASCWETVSRMDRIVLQPMSGVEEIRQYLYEECFTVLTDEIIAENGRLFQLFSVRAAEQRDEWPAGFPEGFFSVGYRSFETRTPLLQTLLIKQEREHQRRLVEASGSQGENAILERLQKVRTILTALEEEQSGSDL